MPKYSILYMLYYQCQTLCYLAISQSRTAKTHGLIYPGAERLAWENSEDLHHRVVKVLHSKEFTSFK